MKKYLGIMPNEFIIKGIHTTQESLPLEFSNWAKNEHSRINFLSDLVMVSGWLVINWVFRHS